MYLAGTEMHIVTFSIVIFELVILFFQIIYFLERPTDTDRLWYLILLCLLIFYNVTGGLFPDPQYSLSIQLQNILAYSSAVMMSMFFAFYIYKAFRLDRFRWFAYYGMIYFILIPFIFTFIIPYLLTGDLILAREIFVTVAFGYCIAILVMLTRSFIHKYKVTPDYDRGILFRERMISAYLAVFFWISLPVTTYFDSGQMWEVIMANMGFFVMTVTYLRTSVVRSKTEYNRLQVSEEKLRTANEELEIRVNEQTAELKLANEQIKNTFATLAHETKTPLTLINNYLASFIDKYGMSEELSIVKYNLDKLTMDIVNYFDLERLDRGFHIYNHNQTTDFSATLLNSLALFKPLAQTKQVRILDELMDKVLVRADPDAIVRIINNIVENAIRYNNPQGRVSIFLRAVEHNAVFIVSDTGKGIPQQLHNRVLEPYFQVGQEKKSNQGMGMGLAIVNKILLDLGGTIQVESNAVRGTKITVTIPLQTGMIEPENIQTRDKFYASVEPLYDVEDAIHDENLPCLLIVEDHLSLLQYLKDNLSLKYNVYTATNGAEALEKLDGIDCLDLIISDVMMEGIDGFKLGQIVKKHLRFSHIPLLFLTAKTRKSDRMKGLEIGAHDYISKPFDLEELLYKINVIIDDARKQGYALISQARKSLLSHSSSKESLETHDTILLRNFKHFNLSSREIEIFHLVEQGYSNAQIAESLIISERTVTTHVRNTFKKVGVNRRSELVNKLKTHRIK